MHRNPKWPRAVPSTKECGKTWEKGHLALVFPCGAWTHLVETELLRSQVKVSGLTWQWACRTVSSRLPGRPGWVWVERRRWGGGA